VVLDRPSTAPATASGPAARGGPAGPPPAAT